MDNETLKRWETLGLTEEEALNFLEGKVKEEKAEAPQNTGRTINFSSKVQKLYKARESLASGHNCTACGRAVITNIDELEANTEEQGVNN